MDEQPPAASSPERLFAEFLDRVEAGGEPDFEAFCRQHPAHAASLQRVHVRWQAMNRAFTAMSRPGPEVSTEASSAKLADLEHRLRAPGGRLARYVLGEEIARGAMGRIVRAWDEDLRREVALKIHRGSTADVRQRRRFLEEAQIAAQLDHPGIVSVHEVGVDGDGRPFFAMQLVRGSDLGRILADAVADRDGWTRTRVLGVLLRVCEAMAFAHAKGVVHRDLKPANVMVGRFGETYVMDWGLAHAGGTQQADGVATIRSDIAGEDADSVLLTRSGDVLGTPAYMAPEQAVSGVTAASPAADVYSLGAILYHLLAGAMPFATARTADEVLAALREGPPSPLPDEVPAELRAICERAMAREPRARYADMAAFGDDLRAFLEVRTVRAYATGRFAELRKWVVRNRALAGLGAMFVLALAISVVAVTTLWMRAEADRARADVGAARLRVELDRSSFQAARQAMQLDNSAAAADSLWRMHIVGSMPRSTAWALRELTGRDPYLVTLPERDANMPVAYAVDGGSVLVGGADGRLQIRDPASLALLAELGEPGARLTCLASLDADHVVAGTQAGELLWFHLGERRLVRRRPAHRDSVTALAVSASSRFASAGADGRVLWWPAPAGEPLLVVEHETRITALAVRPSSDGVVAGADDGALLGASFTGHWRFQRRYPDSITAIAFGADDLSPWIGGTDRHVRRLHLDDPEREWVQPTRNGTCRQLVRLDDGSLLLGGWWRIDRMTADGRTFTPLALRGVSRMAISPDGRRLVTTNATNGMGLIDIAPVDRRVLAEVGHLTLAADGHRYAVARHGLVSVHAVDDDATVRVLSGTNHGAVRLDHDGAHLAVLQPPPVGLAVFEVASGERLHAVPIQLDGSGDAFEFAPDGSEIAFAAAPTRLRRMRTRTGEVLAEHEVPAARWFRIAYSGDGRHLAALAGDRQSVRVFDLAGDTVRDENFAAELTGETRSTIAAFAISMDGSRVAVGTWQGRIVVRGRDGATTRLAGHNGTVWSLWFAAHDPGLLLSSGGAQGIAGWDLDTAECCFQAIEDEARNLALSTDGRTLSCRTPAGGVLLDLSYRDRHIAGNLPFHLDVVRKQVGITSAREGELRAWAAAMMAQPWPRWR